MFVIIALAPHHRDRWGHGAPVAPRAHFAPCFRIRDDKRKRRPAGRRLSVMTIDMCVYQRDTEPSADAPPLIEAPERSALAPACAEPLPPAWTPRLGASAELPLRDAAMLPAAPASPPALADGAASRSPCSFWPVVAAPCWAPACAPSLAAVVLSFAASACACAAP